MIMGSTDIHEGASSGAHRHGHFGSDLTYLIEMHRGWTSGFVLRPCSKRSHRVID